MMGEYENPSIDVRVAPGKNAKKLRYFFWDPFGNSETVCCIFVYTRSEQTKQRF